MIKDETSFTLIELVVVIGILAVLAVVVVVVLNPADWLKQSRDSQRISDLDTINKALGLYGSDGGSSFGTSNTVYVSIPSSQTNCSDLGLPSLPPTWSYKCATPDNFRKVDGNGWIPVNLTVISFGSALDILPIDPINTTSTGTYYTYVTGGSWEFNARLESDKYGYSGSKTISKTDGGNNDYLYEIGTNLALILDNENYIRDGDMELSDNPYWANYYYYTLGPLVKSKDTATLGSGLRSLHLVTEDTGYEGVSQSLVKTLLPQSNKVYIQLAYKVAPSKSLGWECYCSNLGCCWRTIFNNSNSAVWTILSRIDDVSGSTGLTTIYITQPYGVNSEFWLDDVIIRPAY